MNSKLKIGLTSAVALGCAGITYSIFKRLKPKNASDALNYLEIEIITSEEQCDQAVTKLRSKCKVHHAVGIDCEFVIEYGIRQPVALLQLSTYDGYCALFRLCKMYPYPKSLRDFLEDNSIYKVGVVVTDDAKNLAQDYTSNVYMQGTLDLRHLVDLCGYDGGSLETLSKSLLGIVLEKTWMIRYARWAAEELSTREIEYAAASAHLEIKLFVKLINDYHKKGVLSWLQPNNDINWEDLAVCKRYANIPYKVKHSNKDKKSNNGSKEKEINKEIQSKRYPHTSSSKSLNHDCLLETPDGDMICICSNKKAVWYVARNLGDVVSENPLKIRLRFEPAGHTVGDVGRFYQLTKENKCVVCGANDSCIRKNVVPRMYRIRFPAIMRDYSSHDAVVLCGSCEKLSMVKDRALYEQLALTCSAPLITQPNKKLKEDGCCRDILAAARVLLNRSKKHTLPRARRKYFEKVLLQYYLQQEEITEELLKEAADIQILYENINYESHGYKVMEYYIEHEGLLCLEELWRQHFLDTMHPQYMPALWSAKHNEERLKVGLKEGRLDERELEWLERDQKLLGFSM